MCARIRLISKMADRISSDINPAMLATNTFNKILQDVQKSNLNFSLQVSPFSATIYLKKTLVKDKSGTELIPPIDTCDQSSDIIAALTAKNMKLENDVIRLKNDLETARGDCEGAKKRIMFLEDSSEDDNNTLIEEFEKEHDNLETNNVEPEHKQEVSSLNVEPYNSKLELANMCKKSKNAAENYHEKFKSEEKDFGTEDKIVYNIETNNNFELLASGCSWRKEDVTTKDEKHFNGKTIDENNFEENLKGFLQSFKEKGGVEPKYYRAARTNIKKGYNIFHISLSDVGVFNEKLKGFLADNENQIRYSTEIKNVVMKYGEAFGLGSFKADTSVFINKKNNEGIEALWTE